MVCVSSRHRMRRGACDSRPCERRLTWESPTSRLDGSVPFPVRFISPAISWTPPKGESRTERICNRNDLDIATHGQGPDEFDEIIDWTVDQFGAAQATARPRALTALISELDAGSSQLGVRDLPRYPFGVIPARASEEYLRATEPEARQTRHATHSDTMRRKIMMRRIKWEFKRSTAKS